jgi:leucyl aminopeptidase
MDEMRADMGGAACVVATIKAAASLKLPINIRGELLVYRFFQNL